MARFELSCLLAILACAVLSAKPGTDAQDDSTNATKAAHEIEALLKDNGCREPWEGVFTQQWGFHGRTLYIAKNQWAEVSQKRRSFGAGASRKGVLELTTAADPKNSYEKLVVVPWSKRVYLVEQDRLFSFLNAVNDGTEPSPGGPGTFFVRVDSLEARVEGKPALPEDLLPFLYDTPYRGKIGRIVGKRERVDVANSGRVESGTEVEIIPDDKRAVFKGMALTVEGQGKSYRAFVTDDNVKSIRAIVSDLSNYVGTGPEKGDRLTTRRAKDPPKSPASDDRTAFAKAVLMVKQLTNVDDGEQSLSVDNSQVVVRTKGIAAVVDDGPVAIPVLLAVMETDGLDFDTFVRCYSACDQILRVANPKITIFWNGGCKSERTASGVERLVPGGQLDMKAFRNRVIADIKLKHAELAKKKP